MRKHPNALVDNRDMDQLLVDEHVLLSDMFKRLDDDYFSYLRDLVENEQHKHYMILLSLLHKKQFYSIVKYDENRAEDARLVAEKFVDQLTFGDGVDIGMDWLLQHGAPSFLEVVVGVAERLTALRYDGDNDDRNTMDIRPAFWELLGNLRLTDYTNGKFESAGIQNTIDEIVDECLSRTYEKNGRGGLFPLRHPPADMRKIEIAYQMNYYEQECEASGKHQAGG